MANVGRLAFRVEGDNWVAYYAKMDTMNDAIFMGSIRMGLVRDPDRKRAFMEIMKSALSDFIEEGFENKIESWNEERAPESERSGRA